MYGKIYDPEMGCYIPRVRRDRYVGPKATLTRAGSMSPNQLPTIDQSMGVRVLHHAGRYLSGGSLSSSPGCWSCRCMKYFLIQRWDPVLPGRRWLHESQPSSDQSVASGFLHRAEQCRPVGSPFSSPVDRSCRDMEGLLNQG